jgi:hypothetical protein
MFCRSSGCTSPPASPSPSCAFQRFLKKLCRLCCCSALGVELESAESSDACGASFIAFGDELTCWRHTWTASWTRTKHHPAPIKSMMPDLDSSRCTCRFGFAIEICIASKEMSLWVRICYINLLASVWQLRVTIKRTWIWRALYSWCKSLSAWTALESMYVTAAWQKFVSI